MRKLNIRRREIAGSNTKLNQKNKKIKKRLKAFQKETEVTQNQKVRNKTLKHKCSQE